MDALFKTLQYIQKTYHASVTVKDFSGLIFRSDYVEKLQKNLNTYENPYCTYVKTAPDAFSHCVADGHMALFIKISTSKKPAKCFFEVCHCGVKEYVVPLIVDGIVAGALLFGAFPCDAEQKKKVIEGASELYHLDAEHLHRYYRLHINGEQPKEEGLLQVMALCGESLAAQLTIELRARMAEGQPTYRRSGQKMLNEATSYIEAHLAEPLSVGSIAEACHTSESTLSHRFSSAFGIGIGKYLRDRRLEKAKRLLTETDCLVSDVAFLCGFATADYFSAVFGEVLGMTPTEYRRTAIDPAQLVFIENQTNTDE